VALLFSPVSAGIGPREENRDNAKYRMDALIKALREASIDP